MELNLLYFLFQAGEIVTFNNCSKECHCHPSRGLVCRNMQCPQDQVCITRDGAQVCARREGHCQVTPGATLTTFDGITGPLLASGTYKVSALCDEEAPDWFKVVMEVSDCRDMNVPAATAAIIFVREGVVSVNGNMEVWVSGAGEGVLGGLGQSREIWAKISLDFAW